MGWTKGLHSLKELLRFYHSRNSGHILSFYLSRIQSSQSFIKARENPKTSMIGIGNSITNLKPTFDFQLVDELFDCINLLTENFENKGAHNLSSAMSNIWLLLHLLEPLYDHCLDLLFRPTGFLALLLRRLLLEPHDLLLELDEALFDENDHLLHLQVLALRGIVSRLARGARFPGCPRGPWGARLAWGSSGAHPARRAFLTSRTWGAR